MGDFGWPPGSARLVVGAALLSAAGALHVGQSRDSPQEGRARSVALLPGLPNFTTRQLTEKPPLPVSSELPLSGLHRDVRRRALM